MPEPIKGEFTFEKIIERACQEPTLADALSFAALIECERAIHQARFNYGSGANGQGWDTCFKIYIEAVLARYPAVALSK